MSTRSSAIRWPAGHYFYVVREPVLKICRSSQCAAALVHWAVRWHDYNLAVNNDPIIKRPIKEIINDLFGVFKRNAIIEAFQLLEELEILNRVPSGQDRTSKWLLNVDMLQFLLDNPAGSRIDKQDLNLNLENLNPDFAKFKSKPCSIYDQDYDHEKRSRVEGDPAENHTANDRASENDRLVSNSSLSFFSENSQQPTAEQPPTEKEDFKPQGANTTPLLLVDPDRPETIHSATQQQGSGYCTEPVKREEGGGAAQKTRGLVYKGKGVMAIANLVQFGINRKWWESQQQLAAFQWAIFAAKEQSGYSQPARAVTAIFTGLERKDESAIEEIAGYWARYDRETQTIAAKVAEPMPWVKDGQVIPAYASWVKSNDRWLDGQLSDGTYKINLILTTTKSNKFAREAWDKYQETLKADEARKRRSEEMANEVYAPELPPLTDEQKAAAEAMWLKVAELKAKRAHAKAS
jgi:hypothetical protein